MGVDAVLVNTAIATAEDPVMMGKAFSMAVKAGRMAYLAKLASTSKYAQASSPLTDFYFEVTKHELLRRKKKWNSFDFSSYFTQVTEEDVLQSIKKKTF